VKRPPADKLCSLSLNESGVDADNDERDGRDIAIERVERSRTYLSKKNNSQCYVMFTPAS
jgi:hypothetical protein